MNEAAWYSIFIGTAFKGTIALCLAWSLAILLRKRSAATRHLLWTAAAAGVLMLPFLSVVLPALQIPASSVKVANVVFRANATDSFRAESSPVAAHDTAPPAGKAVAWHFDWRICLILGWAIGAAAAFARMLAAYAALWRVRRSTRPFPSQELCQELSQALGVRRRVDVRAAQSGSMPMAFGVFQPSILMPWDALEWSDEHRRIVLLHELAHVRRGDVATHLLARTAAAVYWWNPLAWIALRESLNERERAADDLVLNLGTRASEYAGHLLDVARTMQAPPLGSLAVAMARRSQLEGRLTAILDPKIDRSAPGRASAFIAAALAVGMIAPLAAIRAQDTQTPVIPADVDAAIRAAVSQKNHEVLDNAAQAAEQLRKYDTAQRLLQSAADIRADVSGRQSVDYGLGLLKLGDLESKRNLVESATDFYSRAAEVLGDRPEAGRALMYLGTAAVLKVDYPKATDLFQHAQRVDPAHSGNAVMWMAVVQKLEKNTDEAETLFKNALSLQDANSPEAVVTMKVYSQFLRQLGRVDEATELDARSTATQRSNAQPASAPSSGVYRIGNGVTPPKVLRKVEPEYTGEARAAGLQGTVAITCEIGTDGLARNFRILRGLGLGLDEKTIDAVSQWQFQPGAKDGQPVPVLGTIEVNWRLL